MRAALPVFWCVDTKTRGKLASLISDISTVKKPVWVEWMTGQPIEEFTSCKDLFEAMAKPPKHPKRVR